MSNSGIEALGELIRRRTGLALRDERENDSLNRFVKGRLRSLDLDGVGDYTDMLARQSADGRELDRVITAVTNPHTFFFRDDAQLRAFAVLLKRRAAESPDRRLSIWSAGCATGEEPFSIAMICAEAGIDAQIVATDVNPEVLAFAEEARFHEWSVRRCPKQVVERFFETEEPETFRVVESVRQRVTFHRHNLADETFRVSDSSGGWDFLFCRNVLLYFDRVMVEGVLRRFAQVLAPRGWLFLGAAEHFHGLQTEFQVEAVEGSFACRRGERERALSAPTFSPSRASRPRPDATKRPRRAVSSAPRALSGLPSPKITEGGRYSRDEVIRAVDAGELATARDRLKRHLEERSDDRWSWATLGNLHLWSHDFDDALRAYDRALELDSFSPEIHYLTGVVYRKLGDQRRAIHAFRHALFLDPTCWMAAFLLAGLYARLNDEVTRRRYLHQTKALLESEGAGPTFSSYVGGMQNVLIEREQAMALCRRYLADSETALSSVE